MKRRGVKQERDGADGVYFIQMNSFYKLTKITRNGMFRDQK